jgi:restriction system protein
MTIPDFQTVMLPILNYSYDKEEHTVGQTIEQLSSQFNLSNEEKAELLPSGTQYRFDNRIHWAITYLSKSGLLERTGRGKYRITPIGIKAVEEKPNKIDKEFLSWHQESSATPDILQAEVLRKWEPTNE